MNSERSVLDAIDALVDEQLAHERSGSRTAKFVAAVVKSDVAKGAGNTTSPLTHSSEPNREGLAMDATHQSEIPAGLCQCGCGTATSVAKRNRHEQGIRKGEYARFARGHGGRARTRLAPAPEVRFWAKVKTTPRGCWLWMGARNGDGYGTFKYGSRTDKSMKSISAHRFSYQLSHGPAPSGMHLDHLCRVRHCVNPNHLELVTPRVNILRGVGFSAVNLSKTHCPAGHEYAPDNTRWYARPGSDRATRYCRRCAANRIASGRPHARDRTVCARGHDIAIGSQNVRLAMDRSGNRSRVCKTCARENTARWRALRSAA